MIAGDILGERARLTPDKTAVVCVHERVHYTYAEANERAIRCAQVWLANGLKPGDRVGILARNRIEYVDAFFGSGKSGVILVPLNYRLTSVEIEAVARDAGILAIMYESCFDELLSPLRGANIVNTWIALDRPRSSDEVSYGEERARADVASFTPHASAPEDIYCLLYTSGTTGKPKGVMVPHRQVIWNAYNTVLCWGLTGEDVAPIITPMCHAGGLFVFLTPIICAGGTIVLHRTLDAREVWHSLEEQRYTVMMAVPTIYKMLMEHPAFATVDLSSVKWFISGGAPLPLYIMNTYQQRGIVFKQGYGLTEAGVNCFAMTDSASRRKPGSIGTPFMFTEARLVAEDGQPCKPGEIGELWLRGPHVSLGYWNNPEATSSALDSEGWFHTGDKVHCDQDGYFYIDGRSKDMFISGGMNVYPAEIEAALLLHPAVQEAAVIGVADEKWGESGVAFVVLRSQVSIGHEELNAFLSTKIARYKLPVEYVFEKELPRTAYGKVIKPELQKIYSKGQKLAET